MSAIPFAKTEPLMARSALRGAPVILVPDRWIPDELRGKLRTWNPKTHLGRMVRESLRYLPTELAGELLNAILASAVMEFSLSAIVYRADADGRPWPRLREDSSLVLERRLRAADTRWQPAPLFVLDAVLGRGRHGWTLGGIEDRGVLSRRVITNAGVDFIVDAFQNLTELENLKFHGIGNPATASAEAATEIALQTELTTQYNPDNTRATGSTTEVAGTPTKYRSVGTNTVDAAATIKEHGILSQAAAPGGTLLDRSAFDASPISLANGDSLQATYDLTINAGG